MGNQESTEAAPASLPPVHSTKEALAQVNAVSQAWLKLPGLLEQPEALLKSSVQSGEQGQCFFIIAAGTRQPVLSRHTGESKEEVQKRLLRWHKGLDLVESGKRQELEAMCEQLADTMWDRRATHTILVCIPKVNWAGRDFMAIGASAHTELSRATQTQVQGRRHAEWLLDTLDTDIVTQQSLLGIMRTYYERFRHESKYFFLFATLKQQLSDVQFGDKGYDDAQRISETIISVASTAQFPLTQQRIDKHVREVWEHRLDASSLTVVFFIQSPVPGIPPNADGSVPASNLLETRHVPLSLVLSAPAHPWAADQPTEDR